MKYGRSLLIISLILNLFLGGIVIGKWVQQRNERAPIVSALIQTVPQEARTALRENIKPNRIELFVAIRGFRQGRRQMAEELSKETLDTQAMQAATKKVRVNLDKMMLIFEGALIESVQSLPQDVRIEWAKRWRQQSQQKGFSILESQDEQK